MKRICTNNQIQNEIVTHNLDIDNFGMIKKRINYQNRFFVCHYYYFINVDTL